MGTQVRLECQSTFSVFPNPHQNKKKDLLVSIPFPNFIQTPISQKKQFSEIHQRTTTTTEEKVKGCRTSDMDDGRRCTEHEQLTDLAEERG